MATLVSNLTLNEAHAEFSKLIDQITAIDEKLKLGKFGEATSALSIAKVQELASHIRGGCLTSNTEVGNFQTKFAFTVIMQLHRTL